MIVAAESLYRQTLTDAIGSGLGGDPRFGFGVRAAGDWRRDQDRGRACRCPGRLGGERAGSWGPSRRPAPARSTYSRPTTDRGVRSSGFRRRSRPRLSSSVSPFSPTASSPATPRPGLRGLPPRS